MWLAQVDISDTNVEKIGSEEDKAVRKQAAQLEEAWAGCGQSPGIEIWRVEAFKIKPWPKEMYGRFYEGDSYVVLHTYKESADSDKLAYDLYFWLGEAPRAYRIRLRPAFAPAACTGRGAISASACPPRDPPALQPVRRQEDDAGRDGHCGLQDGRARRPARRRANPASRGDDARERTV